MRILVTGASGKLGNYLLREFSTRNRAVHAWSRSRPRQLDAHAWASLDLTDFSELQKNLRAVRPDVIVHTAALSAVADCLADPERADLHNHRMVAHIARWCSDNECRLLQVSTDMVFSGDDAPYDEESRPAPLSCYGRSKEQGERAALACPRGLVVRLPLMVGPALGPGQSFYDFIVTSLSEHRPIRLFVDEWRAMLTYADAARALADLTCTEASGVLHVPGTRMSRYTLGKHLALALGVPTELAVRARRAENPAPEPRPRDLTLRSRKLRSLLPHWRAAELRQQLPQMVRETHTQLRAIQA